MNEWIDVKKASELLNISERAVRIRANNLSLLSRYIKGRGGRKMEILLSSLPEDAIARYHHLEPAMPDLKEMEKFSGSQKAEANNKAWILELYHKKDAGMTADDFVAWYNREYSSSITKANLFQWQKKMKEGGIAALVDKRGGYNKGHSSIPAAAWDYFYSLYMTQQQRGVQLCYDHTRQKYPDIPSVYAFHRRVRKIDPYAIIYYRLGENALRDNLPYMERSRLDIRSNDIWFSDHHRMDVFCQDEAGSRICRLWLTAFYDARSGKIVSHICRNAAPNATVIKQCFRAGVESYGVPWEVYFDNGADYRSKDFSQDYPLSLLKQLGVNTIYATPYHGQAKPVERFFRTLEERFGKMFPTYTGRDAKQRPEQMRISNQKILTYAAPIGQFTRCLDNFICEYNRSPSRGADMGGKSPDEVYRQNLEVKREIHDRNALNILCGTFERRTVQKNGIAFKNRCYECKELLHYYKQEVIVSYTPDNLDELNVFDSEMRFIGVAAARVRTPFRHTTEEDYIKAQKEKKRVRKLVREAKPVYEIDTMQLIAKNQLLEKVHNAEETAPAAIEQITPVFSVPVPARENVSGRIDPDGPSIEEILMKKYQEERKMLGG